MKQLGFIPIQANSPQAKCRVERVFTTIESRLVSEMKLRGIKTMDEVNAYLKEFLERFNFQFSKGAVDTQNAYRKLAEKIDLSEVSTMRENQVIGSGHPISYERQKYILMKR